MVFTLFGTKLNSFDFDSIACVYSKLTQIIMCHNQMGGKEVCYRSIEDAGTCGPKAEIENVLFGADYNFLWLIFYLKLRMERYEIQH